jgi:hypothetical protein
MQLQAGKALSDLHARMKVQSALRSYLFYLSVSLSLSLSFPFLLSFFITLAHSLFLSCCSSHLRIFLFSFAYLITIGVL